MVERLIGCAAEQRRRALDFTLGDEPFTTRFTNAAPTTLQVQAYRNHRGFIQEHAPRRLARTFRAATSI